MERSTPVYTGATRLWGPFFPRYHAGVLHVERRVRGPGSGQVPSGGSQEVIPVAMREVVERFLQGGGREPLQPDDYVFFAGDGAMLTDTERLEWVAGHMDRILIRNVGIGLVPRWEFALMPPLEGVAARDLTHLQWHPTLRELAEVEIRCGSAPAQGASGP